ncbi:MAG: DUF2341 domain-containing protein [Candidatus Aenigmatarchaeota archaeon]|nr:DUF2341 domain-containing protein [Candidatus Aenigmarchaeota archaeon]
MKKLFLLIFTLIFLHSASAWFNDDFSYRREIIINDISNIQENFTINITLDTTSLINEGKIKSDCSDLIVVYNNLEIDRDLLDCGKAQTKVYFKIQGKNTTDKYYIYYGNSQNYQPKSNKSNVYYFYDSFEYSDLSSNGWVYEYNVWNIDSQNAFDGSRSVFTSGYYAGWRTMYNRKINLTNFIYTVYSSIDTESDVWGFGVAFNVNDKGNTIEKNRYIANWEYQIGSGVGGWSFNLRKVIYDGVFFQHLSLGAVYPYNYSAYNLTRPYLNRWYKFTIIRNYPNVKVFFDDKFIFDVNDSTYESGSIGFNRYSNYPSDRKSWYDNAIVMLYQDPWPNILLSNEQTKNDMTLVIHSDDILYENQNQFLLFNAFSNYQYINNLTSKDIYLKIENENVTIKNFVNYNNGTYKVEFLYKTSHLGKKKIELYAKSSYNYSYSYFITNIKTRPLIITNNNWENYIEAVSTRNPVLIYENSRYLIDEFIDYYKPDSIFVVENSVDIDNAYYLDSNTMNIIFFRNKNIVVTEDKELSIKASMIGDNILIKPSHELISLINPQKITKITNYNQIKNLIKEKKTNYIVLTNPTKNNSIFAAKLAFDKNAYIEFSELNPEETRNILKNALKASNFEKTLDYKLNEKLFLALIDVPMFIVSDPVKDNKFDDYDGEFLETDTPYGDLNGDMYLDISVGRLNGTLEELSYQLEMKPKNTKNMILISVYGKDIVSNILFGSPLMLETTKIQKSQSYFDSERIVEAKSQYKTVDNNIVKEHVKSVLDSIKQNPDLSAIDIINQIKQLISSSAEGIYITLEFDIDYIIQNMIKSKPFVAEHLPIYNEDNLLDKIQNKDVIIYMAYGNSTHFEVPDGNYVKISALPVSPSLYYLFYTNSVYAVKELNKIGALSSIVTTGNSISQESIKSSGFILDSLNQEIGICLKNGKNRMVKFFKTLINLDFNTMNNFKKEYYTRTLFGEPSKVYDPDLKFIKTPKVEYKNNVLSMKFYLQPNYTKIGDNFYFYDANDFVETGNLSIPIYTDTLIMPVDTNLIEVSYKTDENASDIFVYDYYKILDGRTKIEYSFLPLVYYNNTLNVIDKIEVEIKYTSPIEILNLDYNDSLKIEIYSNESRKYNLTLFVQNKNFNYNTSREIQLKEGVNNISFSLTLNNGLYSAYAILEGEYTSGPKYTWFIVSNNIFEKIIIPLQKIISSAFVFYQKMIDQEIKVEYIDGKKIINYKTSETYIHLEIDNNSLNGYMNKAGKRLVIYQDPSMLKYYFSSTDGTATVVYSNDKEEIDYTGNNNVVDEMNKLIHEYNCIIDKIEKQYT